MFLFDNSSPLQDYKLKYLSTFIPILSGRGHEKKRFFLSDC